MPKTKLKYLEPEWENSHRKMLMEGPDLEEVLRIIFPKDRNINPPESKPPQAEEPRLMYLRIAQA